MKPKIELSKEEVLATIARTRSNKQAARYLGISYTTWKREASKYQNLETGKTLFIEKEKVLQACDKAGICVVGIWKMAQLKEPCLYGDSLLRGFKSKFIV